MVVLSLALVVLAAAAAAAAVRSKPVTALSYLTRDTIVDRVSTELLERF